MKTPLREEIEDFLNVTKTSILFLLIFSSVSLPQININRFVNVIQFETGQNAIGFTSALIDEDSAPDFLVFSNDKKLYIHLSKNDYKTKSINLRYSLSVVKKTKRISKKETEFAFVSRQDRIFGKFVIDNKGRFSPPKYIPFNENPDNFILTKNAQKALLFGKNFSGIEFVDLDLKEKERLHLAKGYLINTAILYDVDNDLNTDIIYGDIFSKSLHLIKNENNFELTNNMLSLEVKKLSNLKRIDYNLDSFDDILFTSQNGVEIFFGDSITTFQKRHLLVNSSEVIDYCVSDFNSDGDNDIVLLKSGGQLFISFSQNDMLTKPIVFGDSEPITDIDIPEGNSKTVVTLSSDAKVTMFSTNNTFDDGTIKLGILPINLFTFKRKYNALINLSVIDSADNKLKVYLNGLMTYYEIPLKEIHHELKVAEINDNEICLAAYTKGEKLIEVTRLNLSKGIVWSRQYYTQYNLRKLKLQERENNLPSIFVETGTYDEIFEELFEYRDFRYQKNDAKAIKTGISTNQISQTEFINSDSTKIIFEKDGKLFLQEINSKNGKRNVRELHQRIIGPYAVEFVNRKNGYIFMLNNKSRLIEIQKFE